MGSVHLFPIDIPEDSFEVEENFEFDPSKLDFKNPEKEKMKEAVLKQLLKVTDFSNGKHKKKCGNFIGNETC